MSTYQENFDLAKLERKAKRGNPTAIAELRRRQNAKFVQEKREAQTVELGDQTRDTQFMKLTRLMYANEAPSPTPFMDSFMNSTLVEETDVETGNTKVSRLQENVEVPYELDGTCNAGKSPTVEALFEDVKQTLDKLSHTRNDLTPVFDQGELGSSSGCATHAVYEMVGETKCTESRLLEYYKERE